MLGLSSLSTILINFIDLFPCKNPSYIHIKTDIKIVYKINLIYKLFICLPQKTIPVKQLRNIKFILSFFSSFHEIDRNIAFLLVITY